MGLAGRNRAEPQCVVGSMDGEEESRPLGVVDTLWEVLPSDEDNFERSEERLNATARGAWGLVRGFGPTVRKMSR